MGTVRREGDWRLEKRREGVYEITFRKEPQMKIVTQEASAGGGNHSMFDAIPVREVSSYSDAEGMFEEKAHGPPPLGMEYSSNTTSGDAGYSSQGDLADDVDISELPPGGLATVLVIAGSFVLYTFWSAGNQIALLLGIGFTGAGLVIVLYGAYLFKTEGWREAWDFFVKNEEGAAGSSSSSSDSSQEKTPPAPESLKNELFFERANRQCEYCEEQVDHLEVHHIQPRSEGGSNDPSNLIVLCPNCHRKADRGAISKSKLKYQITG